MYAHVYVSIYVYVSTHVFMYLYVHIFCAYLYIYSNTPLNIWDTLNLDLCEYEYVYMCI